VELDVHRVYEWGFQFQATVLKFYSHGFGSGLYMGIKVVVECSCGYSERVDSPEGGQSLVGTAANKSVRHDAQCKRSSEVTFPGVSNLHAKSRGFRSGRRY
jgi:hypothetical protein